VSRIEQSGRMSLRRPKPPIKGRGPKPPIKGGSAPEEEEEEGEEGGGGQRNCPEHVEFYSKYIFEKLVHLVGFVTRIYHDARSSGRQIQ
jgi:hypothetical protein